MLQPSFAIAEFLGKKKVTRREKFLTEMERIVPWTRLVAVVIPHYPTGRRGRPPIGIERMLRVYFLQQWYGLADEALEDAIYDSQAMRIFVGIDLSVEAVPDATTLLKFRRLLEKHSLTKRIFEEVVALMSEKHLLMKEGTIVDATIIEAAPSTKNRLKERDPEMHQAKKGNEWHLGCRRAMHGPAKEVHFAQLTQPGEVIQTDWTHAEELAITIAGAPYPHQLCHSVLIHSNWEWATRCSSESLLSLRSGIQAALSHLGRIPRIWQIDNSSTATHRLTNDGKERGFTDDFLAIAAHFALEPRTINVGRPNENGDVESLNGHLKRRLRQHLLLRGSAEFASLEAYDLFLAETLRKANAGRTERVAEELALMRELPPTLLPDYQEYEVRVGWQSTIRIKEMAYSVPSRLIGQKLRTRVSETTIEVYVGRELICTLPRRHGRA